MDIEVEDIVFLFSVLGLFALFLYVKSFLGYQVPGMAILWVGLTLLIISHTYVYIKKKRDMKIEKMRYIFSIVPMYLILIYLTYQEFSNYERSEFEKMLFFILILLILIVSGIAEFVLKKKKELKSNL